MQHTVSVSVMFQTFATFLILFFVSLGHAAQEAPPSKGMFSDFQEGVQSYQKQDYAKAIESFAKALASSPQNSAVLTNLGLAEYQLGKKGLAIAYFRQALSIDPGLTSAQTALKMTLAQLPVKEIPHRIEFLESIRENFLQPISLLSYIFLTALSLLAGGWILLSYLGQKKRAQLEEIAAPNPPIIGFIIFGAFIICASLTLLKAADLTQPRATIIENKVSVQAAPGENQAALFDLYEGLEVIVRQKNDGWVQISYPGALSGWIPEKSLMLNHFSSAL